MLKLYDHFEEVPDLERLFRQREIRLCYSLRDVAQQIGLQWEFPYERILYKTFKACMALDISIRQNFRKVYYSSAGEIVMDLDMSPLACYLFILNSDMENPEVIKAHFSFLFRNAAHSGGV